MSTTTDVLIVLEGDDYFACLPSSPLQREVGQTAHEALGKLIEMYHDEFALNVKWPTLPFPKEAAS